MKNQSTQPKTFYTSLSWTFIVFLLLSFLILIIGITLIYVPINQILMDYFSYIQGLDQVGMATLGISAVFAGLIMVTSALLTLKTAQNPHIPPAPRRVRDSRPGNTIATIQETLALEAHGILISEFEYARETATQSMEERRTVINFYLLVFGGAGTGVVAVLSGLGGHGEFLVAATALLWLVCLIGWLTLFNMIALRLAWIGSANSMNHIKEFYIINAGEMNMSEEDLQSAFAFKSKTLPSPNKHWNTSHYSALLVSLLDSAAFIGGATLLSEVFAKDQLGYVAIGSSILAIAFFMAHWWAYDISLTPKSRYTREAKKSRS